MVLNDTLSNALEKMHQYEKIGKPQCHIVPSSKTIIDVLNIMKKFGYVKSFEKIIDGNKTTLMVELSGNINKCGVIKPRYSIKKDSYEKFEKRYLPSRNMGFMIVSTVQGMLDHNKAKEKKLGGRLIAYCY